MDYFDNVFRDMELFHKNFIERINKEMTAFDEAVERGDLKGQWDVKEINEPNMKGYVAYGQFSSDELPTEIDPLDSLRRPGKPKLPFVPKPQPGEIREPLADVFEEEKSVKLIVELPGVEKDDIQLNISEGQAEIKAKSFYKTLKLPTADVDSKKIKATYKNGVLEASIPKKRTVKSDKAKKITIE